MPNTNSSKKRLKQNEVHRLRNRAAKGAMRTQIRKLREAAEAGDTEKAETAFRVAAKQLDRAGATNMIHPNTAARTKSRLQALIKRSKAAKADS
jgi:small subunit ribosomal protein S20